MLEAARVLSQRAEGLAACDRLPEGPRADRRDRRALRHRLRARRLAAACRGIPATTTTRRWRPRAWSSPATAASATTVFATASCFRSTMAAGRVIGFGGRVLDRRRAEVPELAGNAAFLQGSRALRPVPGASRRSATPAGGRRRRLHGRRRARAARRRVRGRDAGHRDHAGARAKAAAHDRHGGLLLRRRRGRPPRRVAGAREHAFRR